MKFPRYEEDLENLTDSELESLKFMILAESARRFGWDEIDPILRGTDATGRPKIIPAIKRYRELHHVDLKIATKAIKARMVELGIPWPKSSLRSDL